MQLVRVGVVFPIVLPQGRKTISFARKNNDNNNKKILIKEKGKRYGTKDLRLTVLAYIKFLKGATKL